MVIIDLIRELMFQQNKTIGGLAEETGLSYEVIENIVLEEITPTPENANIILKSLGVKLADVLCLY